MHAWLGSSLERHFCLMSRLWCTGGALPVSASSVPISDGSTALCPNTFQPLEFEAPRAMEMSEIANIVTSFRKAARSAVDCGFDGIEIHGANGYIIDQFLKSSCNKRTDAYGGCVANRCRFCLEVLDAIIEVCAWPSSIPGIPESAPILNDMSRIVTTPKIAHMHTVGPLFALRPVFRCLSA